MCIDWKFYEELDDAVYVCDMDTYELEYLNRRCLQDCGLASMEEARGKKCYEVLQKCSGPCAICTNQYLRPGYFYEWKYTNPVLRKTYLLKDTMIERDGRRYRMELTVDVSAQERQQQTLQEYSNNETVINESLRMALTQPLPEQSIRVLLEHLGRSLKSQRVYIFQELEPGTVTNTYEWCAEGIRPEQENLQRVPFEVAALWYRNFRRHENVIIPELEATQESDPLAYEYLKPQGICSLVASPLMDNGEIVGFFGVDNAPGELLNNISVLLEIIGHFIASLLKGCELVKRLEYLSYFDKLTGLKNRHAMDEYLATLRPGESIGVVYLDVMGLKRVNDTQGHQSGDELLQKASGCLSRSFAGSERFRIGGDEFLVLCKDVTREEMLEKISCLRTDMRENRALMAIGYVWEPNYTDNFDRLLQKADAQMYQDKRAFYAESGADRRRRG